MQNGANLVEWNGIRWNKVEFMGQVPWSQNTMGLNFKPFMWPVLRSLHPWSESLYQNDLYYEMQQDIPRPPPKLQLPNQGKSTASIYISVDSSSTKCRNSAVYKLVRNTSHVNSTWLTYSQKITALHALSEALAQKPVRQLELAWRACSEPFSLETNQQYSKAQLDESTLSRGWGVSFKLRKRARKH